MCYYYHVSFFRTLYILKKHNELFFQKKKKSLKTLKNSWINGKNCVGDFDKHIDLSENLCIVDTYEIFGENSENTPRNVKRAEA